MSDSKKNRNSLFVVITGFIIGLSRLLLGEIDTLSGDDVHILIIMAVVNYIALGFVLLFLYNDFCEGCKENIEFYGLGTGTKKRCHLVIKIFSAIFLILYFILGILYVQVFRTSDLNDAISIVALAISIANNGLVKEYKDNFYNLVLKLSKWKICKAKK